MEPNLANDGIQKLLAITMPPLIGRNCQIQKLRDARLTSAVPTGGADELLPIDHVDRLKKRTGRTNDGRIESKLWHFPVLPEAFGDAKTYGGKNRTARGECSLGRRFITNDKIIPSPAGPARRVQRYRGEPHAAPPANSSLARAG